MILLAKMRRPGVNTNVVEIVTMLFERERAECKQTQRVPFRVISDRLHNTRQPTLLPGPPATEEDEEIQPDNNHLIIDSQSVLLGVLVENMRRCRKESFALC